VFSADPATNDMALVAVHYFRMRGITRFGVITPTDATGQDADRAIAAALAAPENRGGSIVADEHFAPTDLAANAQLERIKAARPQVLIAWATGTPFGTALRAINDVGLDVPVMTTNGNLTYAQMRQYKNFLPKELYFPAVAAVVPNDVTDPAVKAAVDSYDAAIQSVGVKPEYISSVAYDPALLVVDALRKFGTSATAAQIKSYIEKQTDWVGATGHYNFMKDPQRGLDASQAFMTRWDAAKNDWSAVSKPGGTPL
jgi:branched-chain amino acid transport system substrate-binding protein